MCGPFFVKRLAGCTHYQGPAFPDHLLQALTDG